MKKRPSSYENNLPRRYDIACVCGNGEYKSQAAGLRKSKTKRTGCPFKMKIVQRKDTGDQWFRELCVQIIITPLISRLTFLFTGALP